MNIFDVAIILLLILGAVIGFKRGFTSELVSSIGFFVIIILAFLLKNPVSVFLYEHLPFFKFAGAIKGVTVLNIALYEVIAFLIVLSILTIILKVLIHVTNLIETVVKFTLILTPISKIGGLIVGIIESYVWVFIILYVISLPVFNIPGLNDSKYKDKILSHTLVLSNITDNSLAVVNEFVDLKEKYQDTTNASQFNRETLDLFLKYEVITVDSVETLIEKDKLKIDNVDEILNKYREG